MKIELKNIKFSETFSEETNCFNADLYIDGKKVGYTKNQGRGGNTSYNSYPDTKNENRDIIIKVEQYCKTLPKIDFSGFSIDSNLESQIDNIFEQWLNVKDEAKNAKRLQKDFSKGICVGTALVYTITSWKKFTLDEILKHPNGREVVKKTIQDIKAKGGNILNNNIPKELF